MRRASSSRRQGAETRPESGGRRHLASTARATRAALASTATRAAPSRVGLSDTPLVDVSHEPRLSQGLYDLVFSLVRPAGMISQPSRPRPSPRRRRRVAPPPPRQRPRTKEKNYLQQHPTRDTAADSAAREMANTRREGADGARPRRATPAPLFRLWKSCPRPGSLSPKKLGPQKHHDSPTVTTR